MSPSHFETLLREHWWEQKRECQREQSLRDSAQREASFWPACPKWTVFLRRPSIKAEQKQLKAINIRSWNKSNKLASLEATLVRNSADLLTYLLTRVKCRATSVAKKEKVAWVNIYGCVAHQSKCQMSHICPRGDREDQGLFAETNWGPIAILSLVSIRGVGHFVALLIGHYLGWGERQWWWGQKWFQSGICLFVWDLFVCLRFVCLSEICLFVW